MATAFVLMVLGGEPAFEGDGLEQETKEESLGQTIERALGLSRGRTDRIGDAGPWLTGPPGAALTEAFRRGIFSPSALRKVLDGATTQMLDQAREDLKASLGMVTVGSVFEAVYGRDFAGLTSLREFALSQLPKKEPFLILVLLKLRKAGYGSDMGTLLGALRDEEQRFQALGTLIASIPGVNRYLRIGSSDMLSAVDAEERKRILKGITAFKLQHPDLAVAIGFKLVD